MTGRPRLVSGTAVAVAVAALAAALLWPLMPVESDGVAALLPQPLRSTDAGEAARRPPFDPERRGWTASGSAEAVFRDPPLPTRLAVKGILIDGASSRALLDDGKGEPAWHSPGTGRDTWRVTAITPESVTVVAGPDAYRLDFMGADIAVPPARRSVPVPPSPDVAADRGPIRTIPLPRREAPGG